MLRYTHCTPGINKLPNLHTPVYTHVHTQTHAQTYTHTHTHKTRKHVHYLIFSEGRLRREIQSTDNL